MNKIKFIYIDIGNVMANTDDYFKGATTRFGIDLNEFTLFWRGNDNADGMTRGKVTPQEFWLSAIKRFKLKNAENFDFLESWMDDYKPITEIHELVKELSKKYKIGIVSNLYPGMFPALTEKGKIADVNYSSVILSYEVGLNKKDKHIYELATKETGLKPEEIFYIDDRKDFLENAKFIGWQTFWFDEKNIVNSVNKIRELLLQSINRV